MELTSRQRRVLAEAEMSRRHFLKLTGQAAAGAAAPQSMLKGLMGSPGTPTISIPNSPNEAAAALIAWAKGTGKNQEWYNKCVAYYRGSLYGNYFGRPDEESKSASTKEEIDKLSRQRINDWAVWNAMDVDPEVINTIDAINWIIWNGKTYQADDALPGWVTQYRLNRWAGKDMGPNHPFVKDREKWDKLLNSISTDKVSPEIKAEFINIIKNTLQPKHLAKAMDDLNRMWSFYNKVDRDYGRDDDEGDPDKQPEPEEPEKEETPAQIPTDEPDAWRTQSVEFENKLRRLVR